ncbi:MAG: hypothetical protein ACI9KF_001212 [Arenicella sp.]|jgi:hypothetical protein
MSRLNGKCSRNEDASNKALFQHDKKVLEFQSELDIGNRLVYF